MPGVACRTYKMIIYSWNMLFRNKAPDRALDFIARMPFDIFCLQEVPEEFLDRLRALPYHMSVASEVERVFAGQQSLQYLVTLSRAPIVNDGRIPLPYREVGLPLRARLFVRAMVGLRLWALWVSNRHAAYIDIETDRSVVRVFNMHLPLATPRWRAEEFETVMLERDHALPTVACGDFNILEKPHITPISWVLGGTTGDMFFYKRERRDVERRFATHQLTNPLKQSSTHPLSRSQLDHILVSDSFAITRAGVISDRMGSDHHPIVVEVA